MSKSCLNYHKKQVMPVSKTSEVWSSSPFQRSNQVPKSDLDCGGAGGCFT